MTTPRLAIATYIIIAAAAFLAHAGQQHYVNATPNIRTGERGATTLWDSESSSDACFERMMRDEKDSLAILKDPAERARVAIDHAARGPDPCIHGVVANPTHGTRVELVAKGSECGKRYTKVRLLSGQYQGKVGCLLQEEVGTGSPQE